ncbi:MAG: alpha/beta hydrolase [Dehalococcoidia bacterium]
MQLIPDAKVLTRQMGDRAVEYGVLGAGPPLVLLHGLGGSAEVWYRAAPMLAEDFTVYMPQLWETSPLKNKRRYTLEDGSSFLSQFLNVINVDSAHVCGSSLGGLIAAKTAIQHPWRVRTLVLAASAGLGREAAMSLRLMGLPLVGELLFRPSRTRIVRLVHMLLQDHEAIDDALVDALFADRLRPGVPSQMLAALRSGIGPMGAKRSASIEAELPRIQAPTLLLWGEFDPLFPLNHAQTAAQAIPEARVQIVPGTGHWPYVERPEAFTRAVTRFIMNANRPPRAHSR